MQLEIPLLCLGLLGLWAGTELTIRGAVRISELFGLSHVFIGLTILAFGTDLPELVVSISGAIRTLRGIDSSGVVVGNAIGSSLCQISLVIGTAALFHRLTIDRVQVPSMTVGLLGACGLLFLVGLSGQVGVLGGMLLLATFLVFLIVLYRRERHGKIAQEEDAEKRKHAWTSWLWLVLGLGLVILSSELVLDKAMWLVDRWGFKQSFVGAVIVAFGTSLPELALTVTAALKNQPGLSLGNIVGSNVFDCLVPIGIASCIAPMNYDASILRFDVPYLTLVTAVFVGFLWWRGGLQRREGLTLCCLFLIYLAVKVSQA